ncbi:MAG: hypothetical protein ABFD52_13265 [Acidobacteriota bacterium]
MDDDSSPGGYYREIARAFLGRRGGSLLLSPKDQAAIAAWEADCIPLRVVIEGLDRTFDDLRSRGRASRSVSLAFCDRRVRAAFAQHRDRAAGRRRPAAGAAPGPDKRELARREIGQALEALPAAEAGLRSLLRDALGVLAGERADRDELERIDAAIEEALWAGTTPSDRAAAEAEARQASRGRTTAVRADEVRRRAVMAARARRRVPHVSLHYY